MSDLLEKYLTDAGICMLGLIAGTLSTAILYCHKQTRSEPKLGGRHLSLVIQIRIGIMDSVTG